MRSLAGRWTLLVGLATMFAAIAADPPKDLAVGDKAPAFKLKDLEGKEVTLDSLKGKVVLLDFWMTTWPPCRLPLPYINRCAKRAEARDGKLVVLAIDLREEAETVKKFVEHNGYEFRVPLDPDATVGKAYRLRKLPTFFVINKDGTIGWLAVGYDTDKLTKDLDKALDDALAAKDK